MTLLDFRKLKEPGLSFPFRLPGSGDKPLNMAQGVELIPLPGNLVYLAVCSEPSFVVGLMSESLMRALGFLLCACVRYSCKLSFYCDCLLTFIRLDTPEYTEPRSTPSMSLSVYKLIEEGGEPGRLLTGHLFAVTPPTVWPHPPHK